MSDTKPSEMTTPDKPLSDDLHPLDNSLGDIHETAIASHYNGDSVMATRLATAHFDIQQWAIAQEGLLSAEREKVKALRGALQIGRQWLQLHDEGMKCRANAERLYESGAIPKVVDKFRAALAATAKEQK